MAESNIIQMCDHAGNNQYPASLASIVYDDNGKTVAERLAALEVLLKMFEWDGEVIKAKASFYSVGQVSASKKGEEGEGGSGAGMMLLTEWDDSITDLSSYALGANLGKGLRDEIASMKANPASYITLKTINNQSLFGSGNIEVQTTVGWNDIVGKPTNLSEFTNDKGYITEVTESMIVNATDAIANSGKVLISTGGTLNWVLYPRNLSDLTDDVVAGKYLPLTGGTISDSGNAFPLVIKGTASQAGIRIRDIEGTNKAAITWAPESGVYIYNYPSGKYISIKDDGTPTYYGNTLLHSGNVGEYKVGDSDKLGGEVADRYMVSIYSTSQDINALPYDVNRPFILRVGGFNPNLPTSLVSYGNLVHFCSYQADTAFELFGSYKSDTLLFRRGEVTTIFQNPWRTIAFIDSTVANADTVDGYHESAFAKVGMANNLIHSSNEFTFVSAGFAADVWLNYRTASMLLDGDIKGYYFGNGKGGYLAKITAGEFHGNAASATKLATPRTIWGQSFDGTGDVNGDLNMRYSKITFAESADDYHIGWGSGNMLVYANYYGHYFTTNGSERMRIVQNGNVGIGIADPKEKLHINGAARANQIKIIDKADTFYPLTIYNDWYGDTGVKYSLIRLLSSTDNARGGFIRVGVDGAYGRFHSMSFGSVDSSYVTTLHLNASGNVTIGNSDLAGTDAKLAVWGNQRIYRGSVTAEYLDISVADVSVYYNAYDPDGYCHQYFQSNGNTRLFINGSSGNVGIGTTSPAYLLDVAGTGRFAGLASFDAGVKIGTTALSNTNLGLSVNTSLYPLVTGLSLGHSTYRWHNVYANNVRTDEVKIGDATLTWDGAALKVDKPFYSTSQVSSGAKAVEAQAVIAPLALPRYPTASTKTEYTDAEIASQYGLTTEVLDNLAGGIYTRVTITYIGTPHVWDYEVYFPYGGNKKLVLRNNLETSFKFERDSTTGKWKITNA